MKNKIKLEAIKIDSFTTTIDSIKNNTIKGGTLPFIVSYGLVSIPVAYVAASLAVNCSLSNC